MTSTGEDARKRHLLHRRAPNTGAHSGVISPNPRPRAGRRDRRRVALDGFLSSAAKCHFLDLCLVSRANRTSQVLGLQMDGNVYRDLAADLSRLAGDRAPIQRFAVKVNSARSTTALNPTHV